MNKLIIALSCVAALAIWSSQGLSAETAEQGADRASYEAALAAAEAVRKEAAELRYEWNTIAPLIEKSQSAAAEGDFTKAIELANEARKHGELAVAQAKYESDHWQESVVR